MSLTLALRHHRLPRFWLALTLGSVALALALVYGWERQLPQRIEAAARAGRLDDCLRYSEQLQALGWLARPSANLQGQCRRQRAQQLWQQGYRAEAIRLQGQLLTNPGGLPADRRQLDDWRRSLVQQALARFRAGDLPGALTHLAPMGEDRPADGASVGDRLRQNWARNRLQRQRAERLMAQQRWWEALDALNRLDHPWWQQQSLPLRRRLQAILKRLEAAHKEHDGHGSLPTTVPLQQLDALVRRRIAAGMDDWQAFRLSCQELGGQLVEAGPDTACQRR